MSKNILNISLSIFFIACAMVLVTIAFNLKTSVNSYELVTENGSLIRFDKQTGVIIAFIGGEIIKIDDEFIQNKLLENDNKKDIKQSSQKSDIFDKLPELKFDDKKDG